MPQPDGETPPGRRHRRIRPTAFAAWLAAAILGLAAAAAVAGETGPLIVCAGFAAGAAAGVLTGKLTGRRRRTSAA